MPEVGDWDEVVALGSQIADRDDLTLKIRLYLATALAERRNDQAALAVYDEALRSERDGRASS